LPCDEEGRLTGKTLRDAVVQDRNAGLIPCYVIATLGTTPTCAFDDLESLGVVCQEEKLWMHVDAAYAGTAFVCPEYQHYMKGIEYADSFNFNPHKWMLVNFDCSALWVKNAQYLVESLNVERIYLKHKHMGSTPEYLHWQIPLGRRFRSLKLWFVLRTYGVEGIQKHVRHQVGLAKYFEKLLRQDDRFEVVTSSLGLVCFRLMGDNELTQKLLERLVNSKQIFVVPCKLKGKYLIRFVIASRLSEIGDVEFGWAVVKNFADDLVPRLICNSKPNIPQMINNGSICNEKAK